MAGKRWNKKGFCCSSVIVARRYGSRTRRPLGASFGKTHHSLLSRMDPIPDDKILNQHDPGQITIYII